MAEVLLRFTAPVKSDDGDLYVPQACGGVADDVRRISRLLRKST